MIDVSSKKCIYKGCNIYPCFNYKNENKPFINVSSWPLDENRSNDINTSVPWM